MLVASVSMTKLTKVSTSSKSKKMRFIEQMLSGAKKKQNCTIVPTESPNDQREELIKNGGKTDEVVTKSSQSGHQIVNKYTSNGHQVVTK